MVCVTRSGGSKRRSCLGCPGWPPRWRPEGVAGGWGGAVPGPSEEGGREEFEELAARRAWRSCTSDSNPCTRSMSVETASFNPAFSRSSSAMRRSFGSTASIDPLGSSRSECQSRLPIRERLQFSHLVWAGMWSGFCLWVMLPELSWSWVRSEPLSLLPLVGSATWLSFAIGLLAERNWAWVGSFICTVLSVFTGIWVTMQSIYLNSSFFWEIAGTISAFVVLLLLIQSRHRFLGCQQNVP